MSVERTFDAVLRPLQEHVDVRAVHVPHHSLGVVARLRNVGFTARVRADVVHIAGDIQYCAMGVRRSRCMLTILDLSSLHRLAGWRRMVIEVIWYRLPIRWARRVTTISGSVRDELVASFPEVAEKIVVVPCAIPPVVDGPPRPAPPNADPTVLIVGTGANKNVGRMLTAIADVGVRVRIVGRLSDGDAARLEELELDGSVASDLTDQEVVDAYRAADVLLFASTYEGFGMPIVEAQQLGLPVVTSDRSPMADVAGDGAVLVDPEDVSSIAEGLRRAMFDVEERRRLIAAGAANARRFSPEVVAQEYARHYRSWSPSIDGEARA